uniref:Ig-like domain-containing protein n=1 Tax=Varanus komodoensis TaxID=61221 RepID=A0A8D2LM24_VARKO
MQQNCVVELIGIYRKAERKTPQGKSLGEGHCYPPSMKMKQEASVNFPSPFYVVFTFYLDTSAALKLTHSRFIAARRGNNVSFNCFLNSMAKWYKEAEKGKYLELKNTSRVEVTRNESMVMVHIRKLQQADSGIYVCDSNISDSRRIQQQCCSTELRVMGISTFEQVQSRHTLKDAIIVIQSTLLVLFVSIPLLLTLGKVSVFGTPGKRPDSNISDT